MHSETIKDSIHAAVQQALVGMDVGEASFVVERPGDMAHGDYSTNAALAASKILKKNPKQIAQDIAAQLEGKINGVKKVEVAGAGFINFTLAGNAIKDIVHEAHAASWGHNTLYQGKKVMVEYTDPNPFKEFHIGHLMSNAIGESIARLFEFAGADVVRANYQGDLGVHVAKAIWGKQKNPQLSWGEAYVFGSNEYDNNKEEIDTLNKTIYEKSDDAVNALYDSGRAESLAHFEKIYKVLGTKFDRYFFESETGPLGLAIVQAHPEVFVQSEGATIFAGEEYGLHTRVFINSKGLPTYEAKELGLCELKQEVGHFDMSLTVTANEIRDYFTVVRKAAEMVFPNLEGRMLARFHGFMKLTTGKMSSRTGNVITGESLLADLTDAARGREDVAVGAVKYTVLKSGSSKDIVFDPEKSLSLEGDSGPYIQYALVRTRSLLRNAAEATVVDPTPSGATSLERLIVHFPEVVHRAAQELEPHHVVTYLTELASAFNSWYAQERLIVDGTITTRALAVTKAIENTLAQGLQVLGIPTPEEM
jgi:arginyl-tRNA synthetase